MPPATAFVAIDSETFLASTPWEGPPELVPAEPQAATPSTSADTAAVTVG